MITINKYDPHPDLYMPIGSEQIKDTESDSVVYKYHIDTKLWAAGFNSSIRKAVWHACFASADHRNNRIHKFFKDRQLFLKVTAIKYKYKKLG